MSTGADKICAVQHRGLTGHGEGHRGVITGQGYGNNVGRVDYAQDGSRIGSTSPCHILFPFWTWSTLQWSVKTYAHNIASAGLSWSIMVTALLFCFISPACSLIDPRNSWVFCLVLSWEIKWLCGFQFNIPWAAHTLPDLLLGNSPSDDKSPIKYRKITMLACWEKNPKAKVGCFVIKVLPCCGYRIQVCGKLKTNQYSMAWVLF